MLSVNMVCDKSNDLEFHILARYVRVHIISTMVGFYCLRVSYDGTVKEE